MKRSLTDQEDQIWLLRNVFWWYLLPPSISILAFFAHVAWLSRSGGWLPALIFFVGLVVFLFALYFFVYWLNQRCVRTQLEPRRQELLSEMAEVLGISESNVGVKLNRAKKALSELMKGQSHES